MKTDPPVVNDIGRMVHWHALGPEGKATEPIAAILTDIIDKDIVSLTVLHPAGMQFVPMAKRSTEPSPAHWCWPSWTR